MKKVSSFTIDNLSYFYNKLVGKFANINHTHTKSQIKDFPTIPTKTSQLTNDSGFKTTDNNTTYTLTKSGNTITLTGTDGSSQSVTDSDTKITVDSALSSSSTNPVQNKIVKSAIDTLTDSKADKEELPKSFVVSIGQNSDGSYSADKTYNEIVDALALGCSVYCYDVSDSFFVPLTIIEDNSFIFVIQTLSSYIEIYIYSNNSVECIMSEITPDMIGALPDTTFIPTKVSDLTNDKGYLTSVPVTSVNSKTGAVKLTASDVGADASGAANTALTNAKAYADEKADAVATNLSTHTSNKSNPHGVTKSQVGLGNVPNVTTNNQTPTYTQASTLATLVSGETLAISFGKIMKAITDLISHIGNKSNPHGVTKAQIGLGSVDNTSDANKPVSTAQATVIADAKKAGTDAQADIDEHVDNKSNPHGVTASQVGAVPTSRTVNGKALSSNITLSAADVKADASGTASSAVSTHNSSTTAHNDIRALIDGLTTRLNTLADSDDTTLDQMSELVAYVKANKSLIDSITTSKVNVSDIVNNLTTNVSNKPLSAAQGVAIKSLIDALQTAVDQRALDSDLDSHTGNTTVHITSTERTNWNDANSKKHTHSNKSVIDGITSTLVSNWNAAKTHADSSHAPVQAEENQNAFSNIKVGTTTVAADSKTDTLELVGSNVTLTPDATNDKVTIGITKANVVAALGYTPPTTDTKYTHPTTAGNKHIPAGGASGQILRWSADGTAAWGDDKDTVYTHPTYTARTGVPTANATPGFGGTFSVSQPVSDGTGHITAINSRTITIPNTTATTSAAGLMSAADKIKTNYTNIAYGTCSTAAATAAKEISVSGNSHWALTAGSIIVVKFTETNTASDPTFNVNSTGAKSVWYNTALITTGNLSYAGYANRPCMYMYDGTQFVFMGWAYDANTTYTNVKLGHGYATCTTAAATTAKVGILSSYTLVTGGIVAVKFTYDVPASATLNINSKGAKAIYHKGAAIKAGIIKAGDTATFIYSSQYHLISIDRDTDTTYVPMTGASSSAAGVAGLVPAPAAGNQAKYLRGDGTWATPTNTTYSAATQSAAGLMSVADKIKLDGIASEANKYTLPTASSSTLGGVKTTSTVTSTSGLTACPIISGVPYYKDTNTVYTLPTASSSTLGGVKIGSNINISSGVISVPVASGTVAGVTIVYPESKCTTFTSDSGTVTPAAVKKAVGLFGITKTDGGTFENTGTTQRAQPSLKWKTWSDNTPYIGYATDQSDGTFVLCSLKGTNYATGLAIGGGSGNLLWKGTKVATTADLPTLSSLGITATAAELNYVDGVTSNIQTQLNNKASSSHTHNYAGSSSAGGAATSANKVNSSLTVKLNGGSTEGTNLFTFNGSAAKSINITPSSIGAAASSHGTHVPSCSTSNNGQFLRVVNGTAAWSTIPSAEGVSF